MNRNRFSFRFQSSVIGSVSSSGVISTSRASSLQEFETDTVEHLTSLSTLSKRLALLHSSHSNRNYNDVDNNSRAHMIRRKYKVTFAIAGGGSQAMTSLASTPGASSILNNGNLLYDRISFAQYLSQYLPKNTIGRENQLQSFTSATNHHGKFGFASPGAAILLSQAACHQSAQMTPCIQDMQDIIGVGCTSTLVSPGSREDRVSRVYIALSTMTMDNLARNTTTTMTSTTTILYNIQLSNQPIPSDMEEDPSLWRRRNRGQEETLVARLILNSILSQLEHHPHGHDDTHDITNEDILRLDLGDTLERRDLMMDDFQYGSHDEHSQQSSTNIIQKIVRSIMKNSKDMTSTDAAILVPSKTDGTMTPLTYPILPTNTIIFPGSFNPPHRGHVALAQAALKVMSQKKKIQLEQYFQHQSECSSDDHHGLQMSNDDILEQIWATTALETWKDYNNSDDGNISSPFTVLFEMSLTNVDKPAMEVSEAIRRIELFSGLESDMQVQSTQETSPSVRLPKDWGVLLTSAPMFMDKVKCLKKYMANHGVIQHRSSKPKHQLIFVIGTDTLIRIIHRKYYNNDYDNMLAALRDMLNEGVHFVVGGRVEQVKTDTSTSGNMGTKFISGNEELQNLPKDLQEMFTLIPDFRFDISSTELRRKAKPDEK